MLKLLRKLRNAIVDFCVPEPIVKDFSYLNRVDRDAEILKTLNAKFNSKKKGVYV